MSQATTTDLNDLPLQSGRGRGSGHGVLAAIGRTPLVDLERYMDRPISVWAKLEGSNPGGSAKARSAARIIADGLASGEIGPGTTVIESTSGNMGIGLAQACVYFDLDLVCVTDARTNRLTVQTMRALGADVRVVDRPGPEGGDLLEARLALVQELRTAIPDSFWPNQYANLSNPAAHSDGTMREIDEALDGRIDYLFVAAGTAGTVRGCIDYLRRENRQTKVIAVDAVGSILFGGERGERLLPGMGAGRISELAKSTRPDQVVKVNELECVVACRRLATREGILAGASSGGVMAALEKLAPEMESDARCAVILADGGTAYLDTVYDDGWVEKSLACDPHRLADLVRA
ncbi:MAG: 2,3-diaminopropionate biosynthesis protein SbnA [Solirubrobacterales bacterium]